MSAIPVAPATQPEPVSADRDLVVLLGRALRLAGEAGRPIAASRLAGKAWWALHETDPRGAERINGVMHYLARLPDEPDEATPSNPRNGATDG